jgi:hypothetical protein
MTNERASTAAAAARAIFAAKRRKSQLDCRKSPNMNFRLSYIMFMMINLLRLGDTLSKTSRMRCCRSSNQPDSISPTTSIPPRHSASRAAVNPAPRRRGDRIGNSQCKKLVRGWPLRVVCHERSRSTRLRATVREMKEGPSGSAIRSLIPSHRELLRSKAVVGERRGNVGTMIPAGKIERGERKQTASEASKAD